MKNIALRISLLILVAIGSVWIGCQITNLRTTSYSVSVHDGGEYPKKAFIIVNDELSGKIDNLLGDFASQKHFAAVIPTLSGYSVRTAGRHWDDGTERKLREWISCRMDAIRLGEQRMAEQVADGKTPEATQPPH